MNGPQANHEISLNGGTHMRYYIEVLLHSVPAWQLAQSPSSGGLATRRRKAYDVTMPSSDECLLIVDGLALSVTRENISDLFAPVGGLVSVRLATDPFGQSLGFAYVVMETREYAHRAAAAIDGHSLGGRPIRVLARGPLPQQSPPHLRTA